MPSTKILPFEVMTIWTLFINVPFRHAGLEEPALACPVLDTGYLIRRHPEETLDVLARVGSLRLPPVARLEFIPYLTQDRNDDLFKNYK